MTTEELAEAVIKAIVKRMCRESTFLTSDPQWEMVDPYGVLKIFEAVVSPEQIDKWAVQAQKDKET